MLIIFYILQEDQKSRLFFKHVDNEVKIWILHLSSEIGIPDPPPPFPNDYWTKGKSPFLIYKATALEKKNLKTHVSSYILVSFNKNSLHRFFSELYEVAFEINHE